MKQKDEEKLVISLFRKSLPDFPKGRLLTSESPDFILKVNKHISIGIELTRLEPNHEKLIENLKSRIGAKNKKISLYRTGLHDSYWLVVYADDLKPEIPFNYRNKLDSIAFHSDFHRIFLFDLFSRSVFPVKKSP